MGLTARTKPAKRHVVWPVRPRLHVLGGNVASHSSHKVAAWAEPFSALYWRIRVQTYLLASAFVVIALFGFWLYSLSAKASALVYVVNGGGEAVSIGNREANREPTEAEVRHVAKHLVELLYGFNSSTVHQDLAEALSMCSASLAKQLRGELADAAFLDGIRARSIRSEVKFDAIDITEHERRHAQVKVRGSVRIFPIADFEGNALETRAFNATIAMAVVPRNEQTRLNGLEIVRIVQSPPEENK